MPMIVAAARTTMTMSHVIAVACHMSHVTKSTFGELPRRVTGSTASGAWQHGERTSSRVAWQHGESSMFFSSGVREVTNPLAW